MQDTYDTQLHIQNPPQLTHSVNENHSSHADPTHSIIEGRKNVAWKNQVKQNLRSVLSKTKKTNPTPHNDLPSDSSITQKILPKDVPSHDKESQNRPIIEKPIPSRQFQDNENIKFSNRSTVSIHYQTHEDESYRILREHNRDNEDLNRFMPSYARNNLLENKENKDYYDIHNISNHNSIVLSSAQRQRKDSNVTESTGYLRKYDKSLVSSRLLDQYQPLRENNSYTSKYRNEADEESIYSNRSKVNEFLTRYHLLYDDKGGYGRKSGLYSRGLDKENIYNNVSTATSNAQNNTKSRVSEILQDMKQSQEKLKKSYYSYKFDRFRYYLNKIIRAMETRNKKMAFRLILEKSQEKDALLVEHLERREYYLKGKCFNAWSDLVIQGREEREREEEEKRLEEARKAKKCVSPRIQNFTTLPQGNDRQHKEEMDEFVMKIKNRHNQILAHEEDFEDEDNVDWGEERLDAFVEDEDAYSQEDQEDDEGDYEDYEEDIENFDDREMSTIPIPMPHEDIKPPVIEDEEEEEEPIRDQPNLKKQSQEKSQERQRRSPVKQEKRQGNRARGNVIENRIEERQSSKSQEKQQQHQNKLTIQELEERAKERHQKVLEIRRKHHEQKLQKEREKEEAKEREREEQRQKQLEEKRKLEQKKREEQLLKQKKEMEQRRLEEMYEEAKVYDQKRLLRNYGFKWLQRLVQQAQKKVQAAEKLRERLLKQSGIRRWKRAIEEIENERNEELKGKMKLAEQVYERRLKRLGIKVLWTCLKESENNLDQYRRHRDHFLQRQCIKAWTEALPEMRKENFYHEAIQDKLLKEFNFKRLAKKVFVIWKEYIEEEKRLKFKDVQKQYLWNKVNSWLSDYKQKKTPGDETGL